MEFTISNLARIRETYGPQAIAFLGSPFASNEENYLLGKVARAITGTNNLDSSLGAIPAAAAESLRQAFGSEALPSDLGSIAGARTLLVVADDLESSHQVAALRAKDAVVRNGARLILVSPVWGELCDFAEVWVQPAPGCEASALAALDAALQGQPSDVPAHLTQPLAKAAAILAAAGEASGRPLSIVYALPHLGSARVRAVAAALANIAITCCGEEAPAALLVLPQEANVWGMRDVGVTPHLLPGHRPAGDEAGRRELERLWGAPVPSAPGLTFDAMLASGAVKGMVVFNDNPLMLAPARENVRQALKSLEFLAVIDSLATDTARMAHAVLPEGGPWAKEGTTTSADRRVLALHQATALQGQARQGWRILSELGAGLAERFRPGEVRINYRSAAEVTEEMAHVVPLFRNAGSDAFEPGQQQVLDGLGPKGSTRQPVAVPPAPAGSPLLMATRTLFTSYEAAALHSPDADKLHREDALRINPADAAAHGLTDGGTAVIRTNLGEMRIRVHVTEEVPPGVLWAPLYYDGGAPAALFGAGQPAVAVEILPS